MCPIGQEGRQPAHPATHRQPYAAPIRALAAAHRRKQGERQPLRSLLQHSAFIGPLGTSTCRGERLQSWGKNLVLDIFLDLCSMRKVVASLFITPSWGLAQSPWHIILIDSLEPRSPPFGPGIRIGGCPYLCLPIRLGQCGASGQRDCYLLASHQIPPMEIFIDIDSPGEDPLGISGTLRWSGTRKAQSRELCPFRPRGFLDLEEPWASVHGQSAGPR